MRKKIRIGLDVFQKSNFGFLFRVRVWASTSFDFQLVWLPFCLFHKSLQFLKFFFNEQAQAMGFFLEMFKLKEKKLKIIYGLNSRRLSL